MRQCMMVDVAGLSLTEEDIAFLSNPEVAGIILFKRNYNDLSQLKSLVQQIKALPRQMPLLITVDQEGGKIQRFLDGFTRLPALSTLGRVYENEYERSLVLCRHAGYVLAAELIAAGVDLSFAPVLDIDRRLNTVIGDRSFHAHPGVVAELASAMIDGMQEAGMTAVGKHFPGHGGVAADTHTHRASDQRVLESIMATDLLPFSELVAKEKLAGVMTAHIAYLAVDDQIPCFSSRWLKEILRGKIGFKGVIFSDALDMAGAKTYDSIESAAEQALLAGCDIVLVCNDRPAAQRVLARVRPMPDQDNAAALAALFPHKTYDMQHLQQDKKWQQAVESLNFGAS